MKVTLEMCHAKLDIYIFIITVHLTARVNTSIVSITCTLKYKRNVTSPTYGQCLIKYTTPRYIGQPYRFPAVYMYTKILITVELRWLELERTVKICPSYR